MQLPPTILSINKNKKKKQESAANKPIGKKKVAPKAKSNSQSDAPEPPSIQTPQDEDHDVNSVDESDEEGDAIMKDDDDAPQSVDEPNAGTSASGERVPPIVKTLRRGTLMPPRTLETTLFDRLEKMYGPGIKRLLDVQYR